MRKLVLAAITIIMAAAVVFSGCAPATAPSSPSGPTSPPNFRQQTAPTSGYSGPSVPAGPSTQRPTTPSVGVPGAAGKAGADGRAGANGPAGPSGPPASSSPGSGTIGLATGGAKDISNFRENISNNYLPLPTDVSYEGLFYDYYFDTGETEPTDKLYAPSYSFAVTRDPISRQTEYYVAVGLNSGMKESDFQRKKLNLVILLDNSGSMGEYFNQYYYDGAGNKRDYWAEARGALQKKMESAKQSVQAILGQLKEGDRFSVVIFNSNASLVKPMGPFSNASLRTARANVDNIVAGGSTNLGAGMELATDQFRNLYETSNYEYENRIIILTDAEPNTGDFTRSGLMNMVQRNASSRIYTTFIGIGVDFNTQLINDITKIRGANYYSVHSPAEFKERVEDEFEYMVTPMVFNLRMNFDSRGWKIEKVFGSPEADQATGELMKVNTLFASKRENGETRGGLVLLKLRKTSSNPDAEAFLRVSYEDRDGRKDSSAAVIALERKSPEYFDNSGIRKGILLTRYASLLKSWMLDERQHVRYSSPWQASVREDTGIIIPPVNVSQWERQSLPLVVSEPYRKVFKDFSRYFADEMRAIGDSSLNQELRTLNSLARY